MTRAPGPGALGAQSSEICEHERYFGILGWTDTIMIGSKSLLVLSFCIIVRHRWTTDNSFFRGFAKHKLSEAGLATLLIGH